MKKYLYAVFYGMLAESLLIISAICIILESLVLTLYIEKIFHLYYGNSKIIALIWDNIENIIYAFHSNIVFIIGIRFIPDFENCKHRDYYIFSIIWLILAIIFSFTYSHFVFMMTVTEWFTHIYNQRYLWFILAVTSFITPIVAGKLRVKVN